MGVSRRRKGKCRVFSRLGLAVAAAGTIIGCHPAPRSPTGPIVITEMDYWNSSTQDAELTRLFRSYEDTHPGITIKRNAVPYSALFPKAVQEAASHTLPDLLVLDNPMVASFAATGVLVPLDSFMQGEYKASDFYAGPLATMKYRGKIYGFPMGNNDLALFYNKKMFAAAHLRPPETWGELTEDARLLTHGDTYGFAFCAMGSEEGAWQYEPLLWESGGDLARLDSPQALAALQLLTDLVRRGYASRAALNWPQSDVETQFEQGRAAMMENGPWNLSLLDKAGVDYGVVPLPVPSLSVPPATPLGGEEMTITASDPAKERATWDFLHWLVQPEHMLGFDRAAGYIPPIKSTARVFLRSEPKMRVFADEFGSARSRTAALGLRYPGVSQAIQSAEQASLSGLQSPQEALSLAQRHLDAANHAQGEQP